jgi:hypothetical protein
VNKLDDREVAEQARASLRAMASVVNNAPPLRLPTDNRVPARQRGAHSRWVRWGTPMAAAAAVIAVAVALAVIRDAPITIRPKPADSTVPTPGAVPRYYVAVDKNGGLVVGNTVTGQAVGRFPAPPQSQFANVTAAADDRTFVVMAVANHTPDPWADRWYQVRVTPGASTPVRLTPLPLAPVSGVVAMALSGSGRELAAGFADSSAGSRRVTVYSTATGRVLKSWTTKNTSALVPPVLPFAQSPALTWIDGDRAIAFVMQTLKKGSGFSFTGESVRRLDVATRSGDLMADSRVIWSIRATTRHDTDKYGCWPAYYPVVDAAGTTVLCPVADMEQARATGRLAMKVIAYPVASPGVGHVAFHVTLPWAHESPQTAAALTPLWTDATGGTVLVEWWVQDINLKLQLEHAGFVTGGRFTALPIPLGTRLTYPPIIAW